MNEKRNDVDWAAVMLPIFKAVGEYVELKARQEAAQREAARWKLVYRYAHGVWLPVLTDGRICRITHAGVTVEFPYWMLDLAMAAVQAQRPTTQGPQMRTPSSNRAHHSRRSVRRHRAARVNAA